MKAAIAAAVAIGGVELNKWVQARGGWTKVYAAFQQGSIPAVLALPVTNTTNLIGAATGSTQQDAVRQIAVTNPSEAAAILAALTPKPQQPWPGLIPSIKTGIADVGIWFNGPPAQPGGASGPVNDEPVFRDPIDDTAAAIATIYGQQVANQQAYIDTLASS